MEIKIPLNNMDVEDIQKNLISFINEHSYGCIEGIRIKYIYAIIKEFCPWYLEASSHDILSKRISYIDGIPTLNLEIDLYTPEAFIIDSYSISKTPTKILPFDTTAIHDLFKSSFWMEKKKSWRS